jgi:diacylglycerol kinase (ATP)
MLDIIRLLRAIRYSYAGLLDAVRYHTSFRQELIIGIILTPIAIWLGEDGLQHAMLIGALVLVLIVELLNTAIESVVDRIGTEHNELSGRAKDMGSAAVFLSLLNVPLVWGLVLLG